MRYARLAGIAALALLTLVFGPEAQATTTPIIACAQTVATNAVLTHDLVCTGHGVVIGADGITIDLKGFTIRGDRGSGDFGIDDAGGYDGITVKNGVIRNFDNSIYAAPADDVTASGLTVTGDLGIGVYILGDRATVTKTTMSGNGVGVVITGNDASVSSVLAARDGTNGVVVQGDRASISKVTATSNNTTGIGLTGHHGTVRSSAGYANGVFGIFVDGDFDVLKSDLASGNGGAGLMVDGYGATITASTSSENTGPGIHVDGDVSTIKSNRADANGYNTGSSDLVGLGIFAENYIQPPIGKNVATANDDPADCAPASLC